VKNDFSSDWKRQCIEWNNWINALQSKQLGWWRQ
jgi:hypothetical protein